jgi:hypothetical protein
VSHDTPPSGSSISNAADDVQRLIVTKSQQTSVFKDDKDRRISAVEAMSHMQFSPSA